MRNFYSLWSRNHFSNLQLAVTYMCTNFRVAEELTLASSFAVFNQQDNFALTLGERKTHRPSIKPVWFQLQGLRLLLCDQ